MLKNHPHLVVTGTIDVMYCTGDHPEDLDKHHEAYVSGFYAVVVPPMDNILHWPPAPGTDQEDEMLRDIGGRFEAAVKQLIIDMPGYSGEMLAMQFHDHD